MDIAYVSELDPTWTDETLSAVLHPEMGTYALPAAQMACMADAVVGKLEWCAGCQGSLFPLMGYVGHHASPLQASSLLVHRLLTRMHRVGSILDYPEGEFCTPRYNPFPRKSNYKLQLIHPVVERQSSHALGKSDIFWGFGKSRGLDYSYIVWMKRQCCLDSVKFMPVLPSSAALDALKIVPVIPKGIL